MTDQELREAVVARLDRIEAKQDRHDKAFTEFRTQEFPAMRERVAKLEVKAGIIGLIAGLLGAWVKGAVE